MTAESRPVRAGPPAHQAAGSVSASRSRVLVLGGMAVALVSLAIALWVGGSVRPDNPALAQAGTIAGQVTAGGLAAAKLAMTAAGTITVGWLLMVVVFLPGGDPPAVSRELSGAGQRCLQAASLTAALWALAALTYAAFSVSEAVGRPVTAVLSGAEFTSFLLDVPQGQAVGIVVLLAAAVSVAAPLPRTAGAAGYLLVLALAGLLPPVFTGHSAANGSHTLAIFSLAVHIVAAAAWVGGLVVLLALAVRLADRLPDIVPRYSRLALVCFTAVAGSGLVNAWIRLGGAGLPALGSRYGALVAAKAAALAALAALGWWHRRVSIPALQDHRRTWTFLRVAAVEVMVMAAAFALATGLSRTAPPPGSGVPGTAGPLEFPLPGPPSIRAYALDWWIDPLLYLLTVAGAALYAIGLIRLRRTGLRWPLPRTLAWYTGLAIVFAATSSGLGRYSMVLFSAHMVQHMALSMLAPAFLLLGAPITLALRVLPAGRAAAGRSLRELLVAVLHSQVLRLLTHPVVGLVLFIASLYGFYYTPLFEASMRDHTLHSLTMVHFLLVGLLYLWPIIGVDTGPRRLHPVMRFLLMLVVMPFHAFFGIGFMMSQGVLAADWYTALGRAWGASALHDQQVGGGLAWSFGEIATLIVVLALVYQWFRGDLREARRLDRADELAARRGEADELAAYNAHLARLAAHAGDTNAQPAAPDRDDDARP